MLLGCMGLRAQNVLLSKEFRFVGLSKDYLQTEELNSYYQNDGLAFSGKCFAMNNAYLQLGNVSNDEGSVTLPVANIPFKGKAKVIIRTKRIGSNAEFVVTINETSQTFQIPDDNYSHPTTIIVNNWTPPTKITITKENGKGRIYVMSVEVYDDTAPYLYESFNGMEGPSEFDHPSNNYVASNSSCDNVGSVFTNDVRQTKGAILLVNGTNAAYTTPVLSNVSAEEVLLTYKYAFGSGNTGYYSIAQNGVATALHTGSFSGKASKTWYSDKVIVTNLTNTSTLTFSGNNVFFDDILLQPIPSTISEETDNSIYLEVYNQAEQNVKLTRTLTAGIWNTLCLPFSMTKANFPNGTELRTLTSATNGEFVFNSVDEVPAGRPFLVKVTSDVVNPVFENVTVQNVEPEAVGNTDYKFCGTYSPVYLNIDGTNVFLGTDGKFHKPTETGNCMKGLRAYFIVPSNSNPARVSILDEPSAIHSVEADTTVNTGCFDLTGRRHDEQHLTRGLYVRNGKKFYVK